MSYKTFAVIYKATREIFLFTVSEGKPIEESITGTKAECQETLDDCFPNRDDLEVAEVILTWE